MAAAAPLCVVDVAGERRGHDGVDVRLQASDGLEVKGALGLRCIRRQLRGGGPHEGEKYRRARFDFVAAPLCVAENTHDAGDVRGSSGTEGSARFVMHHTPAERRGSRWRRGIWWILLQR